jgi:hypothetical protein
MSIADSTYFIREVRKCPQNFFLIHYSCQSLYDDNEGLSPRITSIAISHYSTGQIVSFSTHAIAEEMHIGRDDVMENFDDIELELLSSFYKFIRDRRDKYWVHWNMRNLTYGFEHLEHRYRALGGRDAAVIPVERRLNLNDLISDRYGSDYAPHPKLKSLMDLNGGTPRHFLDGKEEIFAFKNMEFIRMHSSTLAKVAFFSSAMNKFVRGKLHTGSHGYGVIIDRIFEGRIIKTAGLVSVIVGIFVGVWQIFLWVSEG